MKVIDTKIKDVKILCPKIYGDDRGYFYESYSKQWFNNNICNTEFIQDNESYSTYGILRGLHYQKSPYSQSKLVRVVHGKVLDVVVDLRKGSPTFLEYESFILSAENKKQLFVPRGFAHGYVVLSESAIFQYKCDNYYAPEFEGSIAYNDPKLNIDWIINKEDIKLSDKDKQNPQLIYSDYLFEYSK